MGARHKQAENRVGAVVKLLQIKNFIFKIKFIHSANND